MDSMKKSTNGLAAKAKTWVVSAWRTMCSVGKEDPRRVFHSLKVGFSLTIVSLLYLMEPFFKDIGQNAIWAVMTVVVVLEFTAGATLCKGLNRGIGTLLAGSSAFLMAYIAQESHRVFRAIFIGISVFAIGSAATYIRFIPYIKKNYDYGVLVFLLTFNLITVSSFRVDNVRMMVHERLYTIAIGCTICLFMSLLIFPNWSGQDLHNSTVNKLEGLAHSIEACVGEYFSNDDGNAVVKEKASEDPIYNGYKAVLDSKSTDETLALHASWEPRHSPHCYRFPWQQYVKIGDVLRHFGYTIVALHGCLQTQIQTPKSVRALFKDPCVRLAAEVSKALIELADSIKNRRQCSPMVLSDHLHEALQDLDAALKSQPRLFLGRHHSKAASNNNILALEAAAAAARGGGRRKSLEDEESGVGGGGELSLPSFKTDSSALRKWKRSKGGEGRATALRPTLSKVSITSLEFSEALPFAAFASLLVEAVARLDLVIEEVEELGRVASFREFSEEDGAVTKPEIVNLNREPLGNHLPSHVA